VNLPHQSPLIFAKEVISLDNKTATVLCNFGQVPTLAMFIEASAQSSSAFNTNNNEEAQIGFLTMVKNIELLDEIKNSIFLIKVIKENEISNIKQFTFEVFDKNTKLKISIGSFTIVVPNNDSL